MIPDRWATLIAPLRASATLRRLAGAFLVNEIGDGIAVMLLPLVVERATGSGLLVGLAFALAHASSLVGLPIGGVVADRFDRHRVLRVSFVLRGLLLVVALVVARPAVTITCLLLAGLGGSIDNPSAESAIRDGAGDHLQQVATIRRLVRAMSGVVGMAIGALALELFGIRVALAVDALTFAIAMVILPSAAGFAQRGGTGTAAGEVVVDGGRDASSADGPRGLADRGDHQDEPMQGSGRQRVSVLRAVPDAIRRSQREARDGLVHMWSHPDLRLTTISFALFGGAVSALLATVVVWFSDLPGASDGAYGWSLAAYSVGSVSGLFIAGMVRWRIGVRPIVARTLVLAGGVCALAVVGSDWRMVAVAWAAWGVVGAPEEIVTDTAVARLTPSGLLGRAYAGLALAATIGQITGGVVAGALADVVPPPTVIVGLGVLLAVAGVAVWPRRGRAGAAGALAPAVGDRAAPGGDGGRDGPTARLGATQPRGRGE